MLFRKASWPIAELKIQIGQQKISKVESTKYLGIHLDECLDWSNHVNKILPKLRATSRLMFRNRKLLDVNVKKMIYYAYFHSHVSYLGSIWGLAKQVTISKIQVLQNGVIKNILDVNRRYSTKQVYWQSEIMPFDAMVKTYLALLAER